VSGEWKAVCGFAGLYAVARDGRVMSLGRTTTGGSRGGWCFKTYRPKLLTPQASGAERSRERKYNRVYLVTLKSVRYRLYIEDIVRCAWGGDAAAALAFELRKGSPTVGGRGS